VNDATRSFDTPSGWSLLPGSPNTIDTDSLDGTSLHMTAFVRRALSSDSAPTVSLDAAGGGNTSTAVRGAVIIGVRGVGGVTNTDGVDRCDRTLNAASTNTVGFPSVTTTQQHDLVLALAAQADNPATYTTPTGWNQLGDASFDSALGTTGMSIGYLWQIFTTGATGTFSMTTTAVASTQSIGAIVAFKGQSIGVPMHTQSAYRWRANDGSLIAP
jgi:hypothetical protein